MGRELLIFLGILVASTSYAESGAAEFNTPAPKHHYALALPGETHPDAPRFTMAPERAVVPFYQWDENNGYCGEVSLMQAAMNNGEWMDQVNARLICGTGLSQSGPDGFCAEHQGISNYNAQILIELRNPGDEIFDSVDVCLQNARLKYDLYDYRQQPAGIEGYQQFMIWVKAQVRSGHQVTIGVLNNGGTDPQYDHEVSVSRVGTNHDPDDPSYYDDDVIYFDDHSTDDSSFDGGYTFGSLAQTRDGANASQQRYSIIIPGGSVLSSTGGDGYENDPHPVTAANYAFSISGPLDGSGETLPITLTIGSSTSAGVPVPPLPFAGLNYETPEIGDCTNTPPANWMDLTLQMTVEGLEPGVRYNLYEYDFPGIAGVGADAVLPVPTSDFNRNAAMATHATSFVATDETYSQTVQTTSDKIVVFRCVKADAL